MIYIFQLLKHLTITTKNSNHFILFLILFTIHNIFRTSLKQFLFAFIKWQVEQKLQRLSHNVRFFFSTVRNKFLGPQFSPRHAEILPQQRWLIVGGGLPEGIPRRRWRVRTVAFYSLPCLYTQLGLCACDCERSCRFAEARTCNASTMRRVIRASNINVASRTGDDFVPWTTRQLNKHYPWAVDSPRPNLCASLKAERHPLRPFLSCACRLAIPSISYPLIWWRLPICFICVSTSG